MRSAALAAVLLLSGYVLFAPEQGGPTLFAGSDKVVHLVLFALLAAAVRWRYGRAAVGVALVALYAPVSELVQALALPDRSGDPLDVVADLAGVTVGWLLPWRVRRPTAVR